MPRLDVLVNNAGIQQLKRKETPEGILPTSYSLPLSTLFTRSENHPSRPTKPKRAIDSRSRLSRLQYSFFCAEAAKLMTETRPGRVIDSVVQWGTDTRRDDSNGRAFREVGIGSCSATRSILALACACSIVAPPPAPLGKKKFTEPLILYTATDAGPA